MGAEKPKHIEEFNTIVGLIFAQLYEGFPLPTGINEVAIANAMGLDVDITSGFPEDRISNGLKLPSGRDLSEMLFGARAWLREEKFVCTPAGWLQSQLILTSKAFAVMNATPAGVVGGKSIGSRLTDAASGAGRSASNAAIGDLVGQIIGLGVGVAKGLF